MTRRLALVPSATDGVHLVPGYLAWAPLGDGPHCTTWAAWSIDRWGPVAVKLPSMEADPERARAALRREHGHLTRLAHPAVPRVLASSLDGRTPYLVIELIEGRTLAHTIERRPLSIDDTVRLGLQLASAVRYLHSSGIAHLDLKPDNVMLRGGRATIIDFGAAQRLGEFAPAGPRGTDGHMSPEQIAGMPITESMDIWSLGALLHQAATGVLPAERYRRLVRYRSAWRPLHHLLTAMVDDDPLARPPSMTAVLHQLSRLESDDPARGWAPHVARGHLPVTTRTADLVRPKGEASAP